MFTIMFNRRNKDATVALVGSEIINLYRAVGSEMEFAEEGSLYMAELVKLREDLRRLVEQVCI